MKQDKKSFSIGQIVYILSNQSQNIIPAMVVEEQTIQTLQGINVSWKIAIGEPGEKQKIVDSTKLNGEIFVSLEQIQNLLTKRLNAYIEKTIKVAKQREINWYGNLRTQSQVVNNISQPTKIDPESFLDDLEDYKQEERTNNFTKFTEEQKQEDLKQRLKSSIMPTREELEEDVEQIDESKTVKTTITDSEGRQIIANVKMN